MLNKMVLQLILMEMVLRLTCSLLLLLISKEMELDDWGDGHNLIGMAIGRYKLKSMMVTGSQSS